MPFPHLANWPLGYSGSASILIAIIHLYLDLDFHGRDERSADGLKNDPVQFGVVSGQMAFPLTQLTFTTPQGWRLHVTAPVLTRLLSTFASALLL